MHAPPMLSCGLRHRVRGGVCRTRLSGRVEPDRLEADTDPGSSEARTDLRTIGDLSLMSSKYDELAEALGVMGEQVFARMAAVDLVVTRLLGSLAEAFPDGPAAKMLEGERAIFACLEQAELTDEQKVVMRNHLAMMFRDARALIRSNDRAAELGKT